MTPTTYRAVLMGAVLIGTAGAAATAVAQNAAFPPGTNCMLLTATQRPACLTQQQQQRAATTVAPGATIAPNGAANAQNPTSALTGPSATVAPNTAGPSATVIPNGGLNTNPTVSPSAGATVNSGQTVLPNTTTPNAVAPNGTISPNAVVPG